LAGLVLAFALSSTAAAALYGRPVSLAAEVWNFEADEPGKVAKGFTAMVGTWEVARDGDNQVLAQKAKSDDNTFNVVLVDGTAYGEVDLSVRMKAIAGDLDRGGGLIWRAKDKDNYYIARYNPLEDNFRVYKVEGGKRTQFQSARIPGDTNWHTLRVTMSRVKIACYFDGTKRLEVDDSTFAEPGRIGLWSKADAQSCFDDLSVAE
jgi:hypothetical protein